MLRAAVRARRLPILVVGGGVGGMTAALALHRVGQSSHLVMRDKNLSKSGGAVCLMRGGLRILDRLGLGSTIRSIGLPARHGEVYSRRGARLFTFDLDENEVYVVPRPRLRQAFLEALPPSSVSFGTSFKRLDVGSAADDGVTVTLRDLERGADHQVDAGKVIGADGGRSAVRKFITQPGVSLSTGVTAFRATVPNSDLETYPLHTFREVWGDGRASLRFGCCRMTPTDVYWWANMLGTSLPRLSTTEGGGVVAASGGDIVLRPFGRKLADRFSAFPFAAAALIASTAEASIDRTEIRAFGTGSSPWLDGSGRVLLVGDAARQSDVPYLHHGSSLAIEDGYALAMAVDGCARAGGARRPLDAYELERREATAALQRVWASFDRLAASRSPVSRFVNSQVLAVALARQMQDARAGEPRDAEASLGVGGGR